MTRYRTVLWSMLVVGALSAGMGGPAHAGSDEALRGAVTRLGELNGTALACGQGALVARLREIMVNTAPKQREIGEYFEIATNETFLSFGQSGRECPDGKALAMRIDAAREHLGAVVGTAP
ncbi:MAG: hypothetical protein M0R77_04755 [Gammaproteobacteria bacterium]|nr:hypothetical protein [Gammaproteobacteria bacterium]